MRDAARPRWAYLLTALGLSLVAILFLLLYNDVFPVGKVGLSLPNTPVPTTATMASATATLTRAAVDGLRDSGPMVNPQEGQEGHSRPPGR